MPVHASCGLHFTWWASSLATRHPVCTLPGGFPPCPRVIRSALYLVGFLPVHASSGLHFTWWASSLSCPGLRMESEKGLVREGCGPGFWLTHLSHRSLFSARRASYASAALLRWFSLLCRLEDLTSHIFQLERQ